MSKRRPGRPRTKIPKEFSKDLVKAAKKAGLTNEQIAAVDSEEALQAIVTRVAPKSIQAVYPQGADPKVETVVEPVEMQSNSLQTAQKTLGLNIAISPQVALTWKRGDYEQSELDRFVNRSGIKKQNLVRVIITQKYVPNETSKYETGFEIHYKETK